MTSPQYPRKNIDTVENSQPLSVKVVMTLLVRDEADIIRANLEYHLAAGVDLVLAIDNDSIDGTTKILKEYENTGKLIYFYEPSHDYLQDVWVTDLAQRACSEYQADWVINGDADEFFIPQDGSLKHVLGRIPTNIDAISIKRHDIVPVVRPMNYSPPVEMVYRKRLSLEWVIGHPIADKIIHRGFPDIHISRGAHSVVSQFVQQSMPCPDIITFHYPIRSFEQFAKKVENVGGGRIKNNFTGSRYDHWYSSLMEGKLEEVYLKYQLDPEQIKEKLISGDIIEDHRLANLLRIIEKGSSQQPE